MKRLAQEFASWLVQSREQALPSGSWAHPSERAGWSPPSLCRVCSGHVPGTTGPSRHGTKMPCAVGKAGAPQLIPPTHSLQAGVQLNVEAGGVRPCGDPPVPGTCGAGRAAPLIYRLKRGEWQTDGQHVPSKRILLPVQCRLACKKHTRDTVTF